MIRILGDPLRARIVTLLADGPACVDRLVRATGAKQPTVSHHLRTLRTAGLVTYRPHGRFTCYTLIPEAFEVAGRRLLELADQARDSVAAEQTEPASNTEVAGAADTEPTGGTATRRICAERECA